MNTSPDLAQVGLVLVSHSRRLVEGLAELVGQVAGPGVAIQTIGGAVDGSLGTDPDRVLEALQAAAHEPGAVVLMDLGSSVLAVNAALEDLADEQRAWLAVVDAPLVEGAVAAGVLASTGASLAEVAQAAEEARDARKL
ncbi:MAG TPA: dihydroxyacetone kinase phosphoryl donor subunit DhaM [Chloroflexota bacterium]|nr:dihydroxyacetone kinase phosphoryl donor subunit DhaM [Chloroflexota bacterium]